MRRAKNGNQVSKTAMKAGRKRNVAKRMSPPSRVKQARRAKPFGGGRGN